LAVPPFRQKRPLGSFRQKQLLGSFRQKRGPAHRWTVNPALFGGAESAESAERPIADAA